MENGGKRRHFLRNDPQVEWVNYAGFSDIPYHTLTQKYLVRTGCSLLTFGVQGGFEAARNSTMR